MSVDDNLLRGCLGAEKESAERAETAEYQQCEAMARGCHKPLYGRAVPRLPDAVAYSSITSRSGITIGESGMRSVLSATC